MTDPLYTLSFRLRAKDEAGTVLKTFEHKDLVVGHQIGFGAPEPVMQERIGLDMTDESYMIGARNTWTVRFEEAEGGLTIEGDTGYDSLEATLNAGYGVGHEFELSLDGGATWIRVLLDSAPEAGKPGEMNVGKTWDLTLRARALTDAPCLTS